MTRYARGWETRRLKQLNRFRDKLIPANWRVVWFTRTSERLAAFFSNILKGITLSLMISCFLVGCAHTNCVRVPRPLYPPMNTVKIQQDGTIDAQNRKALVENMLNMSKLIDELELCPCFIGN